MSKITADQLAENVVTIFSQPRELTDADIKALPTTPFVLVEPTETLNYSGLPTQLQVPLFVIVRVVNSTGDYTNINALCLTNINLGSDNSLTFSPPMGGSEIFNDLGFATFFSQPARTGDASGDPILPFFNTLTDALLDNAIVLAVNNQGDGNFTGGNAANRIRVTVLYTIIDL